MRATAWRLRTEPVELPADIPGVAERLRPVRNRRRPASSSPPARTSATTRAMDYRFVTGGFLEPGPATVWMRMRVPLVAGEEPTPLVRVMVAADSGNGVSAALDWREFLFINVDLTVHLHRYPAGEWVYLDALTLPEASGVGLADTLLRDERGRIGRAAQTLLVDKRR